MNVPHVMLTPHHALLSYLLRMQDLLTIFPRLPLNVAYYLSGLLF